MNQSSSAYGRVLYQKEEIPTQGCCFGFTPPPVGSQTPGKRHSQSKGSLGKKIEVTIRREDSLGKNQKRQLAMEARSGKCGQVGVKELESTGAYTSLASKLTSQRNSLHNSRAKLDLNPRSTNFGQPEPRPLSVPFNANAGEITFQQTRGQITNIQLLSEISLVEEEFISHESATMNTLHFLANFQLAESKLSEPSVRRGDYGLSPLRQATNPLQRMQDRKKVYKRSPPKTKLCL